MAYEYDETTKVLDSGTPLVDRESLLIICKEIDADTPTDETDAFIEAAHTMVCEYLDGYSVPTSMLTLIEKYFAAHFAVLAYPSVSHERMGPMGRTYLLKADGGLESTRYGQTAVSLDPTGELKKLSEGEGKKRVTMASIGNGIVVV